MVEHTIPKNCTKCAEDENNSPNTLHVTSSNLASILS
jgi:hypothetical protein